MKAVIDGVGVEQRRLPRCKKRGPHIHRNGEQSLSQLRQWGLHLCLGRIDVRSWVISRTRLRPGSLRTIRVLISLCACTRKIKKINEINEIKTTAEYFRRGLMLGLHSVTDVMPWLDRILTTEATPDIALIEASLSGSQGTLAVADWLAQTQGAFDNRIVAGRLLGAMGALLQRKPAQSQKVTGWLYQMAMDDEVPDEAAGAAMWYFDDALGLAVNGVYGSAEELCDELRVFLNRYVHGTE